MSTPSLCACVGLCRHCAHGSSSSSSNSTSSPSPSCPTPSSTCGHPLSPHPSHTSPTYLHTHPHQHLASYRPKSTDTHIPTPARQSPSRKVDNAPCSIHCTPQVMYALWVAPLMPSVFSPHARLSLCWHPTALSFRIEGRQDGAPTTGAALAGRSCPHTHMFWGAVRPGTCERHSPRPLLHPPRPPGPSMPTLTPHPSLHPPHPPRPSMPTLAPHPSLHPPHPPGPSMPTLAPHPSLHPPRPPGSG